MTSLRERKKAEARRRILAAAADLFDDRGYDAVTMRDIATAAEVSYQTVYNYFPGKAHILYQILLAEARSAELLLRQAADPDQATWPGLDAALEVLVGAALDAVEQHPPAYWRTVVAEVLQEPETFGPLMGLMDAEFREAFVRILETARDQGELSSTVDLPTLSQILIYLVDHATLRLLTLPGAERQAMAAEVRSQLGLILTPYRRATSGTPGLAGQPAKP